MKVTNEQIAEALLKANGIIFKTAEMLGVSYLTICRRIKKHKSLQIIMDRQRAKWLGIAESKLREAIDKGNSWAIEFYLTHKGLRMHNFCPKINLPAFQKQQDLQDTEECFLGYVCHKDSLPQGPDEIEPFICEKCKKFLKKWAESQR